MHITEINKQIIEKTKQGYKHCEGYKLRRHKLYLFGVTI